MKSARVQRAYTSQRWKNGWRKGMSIDEALAVKITRGRADATSRLQGARGGTAGIGRV